MSNALFFLDDTILALLFYLHFDEVLVVFFIFFVFFAHGSPKLVFLYNILVHIFSLLFCQFYGFDVLDYFINDIRIDIFWNFFKQFGEVFDTTKSKLS